MCKKLAQFNSRKPLLTVFEKQFESEFNFPRKRAEKKRKKLNPFWSETAEKKVQEFNLLEKHFATRKKNKLNH